MSGTMLDALLVESFARNGRVNAAMLDAMSPADLDIKSAGGGWNLGQHVGHLAEFRYGWLSHISPAHAEGLPSVADGEESQPVLTTRNLAELGKAFEAGDSAALEAVQAATSEGCNFKGAYESHPAHFLQHIIVHDSHHRGQIMSLLRQSGRSAEQIKALEEATWPVWRE